MPSLEELDQIKAALIETWDRPFRRAEPEWEGARLQALSAPLPAHGGLAIGHSMDPASGAVTLELRVNASAGPDYARAEVLAAEARRQGLEASIMAFQSAPQLPAGAPTPAAVFGGRRAPLHLGSSVAHELGFAGTLSAFVSFGEDRRGFLSCAHVLAEAPRARIRRSDPIQHPGQPEAAPPENRIGVLSQHFSRFVPARDDNLDAAIAELDPGLVIEGNVLPNCPEIPLAYRGRPLGAPMARGETEIGAPVVKVGRTSGFTEGRLSAADFLNFRPRLTGRRSITFGRVHEVRWSAAGKPFTEAGDSGALILTADTLRPIGIHFCAVPLVDGARSSYMIPWDRIAATFPIRLV